MCSYVSRYTRVLLTDALVLYFGIHASNDQPNSLVCWLSFIIRLKLSLEML